MRLTRARGATLRQTATRRFPPDDELRRALRESGMGWLAVGRAMSQTLRLLRLDFGARRKRRLYEVAVARVMMIQLKEQLVGIIRRHQQQTGTPVSTDDLWSGNYKELLVDFGQAWIERALTELAREGIVARERRGIVEVLRWTAKPCRAQRVAALRQALDAMKMELNVRYAQEYHGERTYRM